jgi:hypothetical protein
MNALDSTRCLLCATSKSLLTWPTRSVKGIPSSTRNSGLHVGLDGVRDEYQMQKTKNPPVWEGRALLPDWLLPKKPHPLSRSLCPGRQVGGEVDPSLNVAHIFSNMQ